MNKPLIRYGIGVSLLLVGSCFSSGTPSDSAEPVRNTIKIGGSAETYKVLKLLTNAYTTTAPDVGFDFFPPSQTSAAIQGIKSRSLDIGAISRPLTSEEAQHQLTYLTLAETPLVMVVHNSVIGISDITSDQIRAIYSGQITNWQTLGGPDAPIALFDFTEDENEKKLLRRTYLGEDLVITPTAIVFSEDDELAETAAITEFSIATIPYEKELAERPFTILSIDQIVPSPQALRSGDYAMVLPLGIVMEAPPSPDIQSFLDFATSPESKRILQGANYVVTDTQ
ncbi:MAG: substrate-binding domain-containing protein [Cyanobacteria bacterium P01_A01_bin.15]